MTPEIKEMIILAAKAIGYEGGWILSGENEVLVVTKGISPLGYRFNPLTPADSNALMCVLAISVNWFPCKVRAFHHVVDENYTVIRHDEPYTTDRAAACRMAILRVAAEMGMRKQTQLCDNCEQSKSSCGYTVSEDGNCPAYTQPLRCV